MSNKNEIISKWETFNYFDYLDVKNTEISNIQFEINNIQKIKLHYFQKKIIHYQK